MRPRLPCWSSTSLAPYHGDGIGTQRKVPRTCQGVAPRDFGTKYPYLYSYAVASSQPPDHVEDHRPKVTSTAIVGVYKVPFRLSRAYGCSPSTRIHFDVRSPLNVANVLPHSASIKGKPRGHVRIDRTFCLLLILVLKARNLTVSAAVLLGFIIECGV